MICPLTLGVLVSVAPGAACPNCQRTRMTYSPAPRPGGGFVNVVLVAVFGDEPHSVKTPGAVFFSYETRTPSPAANSEKPA